MVTLINPTVADVVAYLLTLDQGKPFALDDPDTGWRIDEVIVQEYNGYVTFTGRYDRMESDWIKLREG